MRIFRPFVLAACLAPGAFAGPGDRLPNTLPLTTTNDIASDLVDGVDRFLLRQIGLASERRARAWNRDLSSIEAYRKSIQPNRDRLSRIAGLRDARVAVGGVQIVANPSALALVARGTGYGVFSVRWPAFGDVHGEGLLLVPSDRAPVAEVIALPDADQTPEQIAGLIEGVPAESQFARRLAESGCRVLVPVLIDRRLEKRQSPNGGWSARLTAREFLYRPAFELGRHIIGYELQKILAAVDWFSREHQNQAETRLGVMGWGEGGLLALYAAALDDRLDAACVSGYFEVRDNLWREPIDRNVFGVLEEFGDAELAAMIAPRDLIIEAARGPELNLPSEGGAPARLATPLIENVRSEVARARNLVAGLTGAHEPLLVTSGADGAGAFGSEPALRAFLERVSPGAALAPAGPLPQWVTGALDHEQRRARQIQEIDHHSQALLADSSFVRQEFMTKKLEVSSVEKYEASVAPYRDFFAREVIGRFDLKPLSFNPRSREVIREARWTAYEVVLDVFPDVIAYGMLLIPNNLTGEERRPVVVCQHGLEGRPQDVVSGNKDAYHDFAARLAERGFITFAPQNLYIFRDRFRSLQRKANPLKKTLFSVIVPQHQQIVDWLKTLPHVDPQRIAFYGLSYGGKTAMRVPPLVPDYCLSICSADFNEWVWKNASTRSPYSYVWSGEYEIFEFDLGSTFNYAEMAALIAPRPFMVERGHFDGVAPDETVGHEFAKVRHLYAARLGLADRCEIEWFVGPHTINGKGTFDFLHKHLNWPKPVE